MQVELARVSQLQTAAAEPGPGKEAGECGASTPTQVQEAGAVAAAEEEEAEAAEGQQAGAEDDDDGRAGDEEAAVESHVEPTGAERRGRDEHDAQPEPGELVEVDGPQQIEQAAADVYAVDH